MLSGTLYLDECAKYGKTDLVNLSNSIDSSTKHILGGGRFWPNHFSREQDIGDQFVTGVPDTVIAGPSHMFGDQAMSILYVQV